MLALFADLSSNYSHRSTEVGALFCLIGALLLASAGVRPSLHKIGLIGGGLALALGFALIIVVMHFGVNPFNG